MTFFFLFIKAGQQRLLFVDREGDLIGEIADRPPLYPIGPWIVTPQGFYAFSETEVSELQAMDDLGTLPKSEIEHLIAQSTHYRSFASSELRAGHPDRAAGRTVHVMRHDGSWKRAASAELGYVEWRGADLHDFDTVYRIERRPTPGAPENHFGSRFRVELTHFDQQEFLPRRGAPMGSTTGQGRPAQWLGTGYYTVFIDNAPALRFRLENDREILSGGAAARLVVEGGPALEFITITRNNRDATRDVILVSAG